MGQGRVQARLQLEQRADVRVGMERVRLLQAIAEHRSITAGGKAVGLSYRGAWNAVQALNALFARPLVKAQVGGREGGEASVTPAGHAFILAFQRIDQELSHVVGQLEDHLADGDEPLERMVWRLGLKTSARNTLHGMVEQVTPGGAHSEVLVKVGRAAPLVSVVTRESVEELALAPGRAVMALVKSSFVILAAGHADPRTSARNRLPGWVSERRQGRVNDEVVVRVEAGLHLAATLTHESAEALALEPGAPVQALVKASHVILAVD